jgi:hypothetical protein
MPTNKCPYCGKEFPDDVVVCPIDQTPFEDAHLKPISIMGLFLPKTRGEWTRAWLRCLIIACLLFLGVEFWSSGQNYLIRSETQGIPRMIGAFFGLLLFLSSFAGFRQARVLACIGIIVSIPAMLLALLPTVAYN